MNDIPISVGLDYSSQYIFHKTLQKKIANKVIWLERFTMMLFMKIFVKRATKARGIKKAYFKRE